MIACSGGGQRAEQPQPMRPETSPPTTVRVDDSIIDGSVVGRDQVIIIVRGGDDPAPPAGGGSAGDANPQLGAELIPPDAAVSPSEPTVGTFKHLEHSATMSDGGVRVSATLDLVYTGGGNYRMDLHGDCTNSLVVVGVFVTVIAKVYLTDGTVWSQARVDLPEAPARGLSDPTRRGHNASVAVVGSSSALPSIGDVRFEIFDRGP